MKNQASESTQNEQTTQKSCHNSTVELSNHVESLIIIYRIAYLMFIVYCFDFFALLCFVSVRLQYKYIYIASHAMT